MRAQVVDSFDVKGNAASVLGATGVVVIYSPFHQADGEVKAVPTAPGFFIPGLDKQQAPVGTTLVWGKELSPALLESAAKLAG